MNPADASEIRHEIDSLRQLGADQFDPVRFFYLEVLARRTASHQGGVKRILEGKLAQALATLRGRLERAHIQAQHAVDPAAPQYPLAAANQQQHEEGDSAAVQQNISNLKTGVHGTALGELARRMSHRRLHDGADPMGNISTAGILPELKATQYFRNTWAKFSIDKRVTQALGQAPTQAGPINSHMLVLRSLALMRDISPDYLNRMTAYVDTLLCLDQLDKQKQATAKKTIDAASAKKTKGRLARGQSR